MSYIFTTTYYKVILASEFSKLNLKILLRNDICFTKFWIHFIIAKNNFIIDVILNEFMTYFKICYNWLWFHKLDKYKPFLQPPHFLFNSLKDVIKTVCHCLQIYFSATWPNTFININSLSMYTRKLELNDKRKRTIWHKQKVNLQSYMEMLFLQLLHHVLIISITVELDCGASAAVLILLVT